MTTPAAKDEDVSLLPLPGIGGVIKRDWPWIANRAAVAITVPLFTALLVSSLGLLSQIGQLRLPLTFLAVGPFAYEAKIVWFLMLLLLTASFFAGKRTGAFLVGLVFVAITSVGFNYTRLRWTEVFGLPAEYDPGAPPTSAWTYGVLLLVSVALFLLIEAILETRRAQTDRDLPAEETGALVSLSLRSLAIVIVGGLAAAAAIILVAEAVKPSLTAPGTLPRLNPVFVLFGLGVVLVLAVILAARRRAVSAIPVVPVVTVPVVDVSAARASAATAGAVAPGAPATKEATRSGVLTAGQVIGTIAGLAAIAATLLPWAHVESRFDGFHDETGFVYGAQGAAIASGIGILALLAASWRPAIVGPIAALAFAASATVAIVILPEIERAEAFVISTVGPGGYVTFAASLVGVLAGIVVALSPLAKRRSAPETTP